MRQAEASKSSTQSMTMFRMEDDGLLTFPSSKRQKNVLGNFGVARSKEHGGAYYIPGATYKKIKASLSDKNLDTFEVQFKDDLTLEEFNELKPDEKMAQTEYCFRQFSEYSKMSR